MANLDLYANIEEKELAKKLQELQIDWQKSWDEYRKKHQNETGADEFHPSIILDGFYPNYLSQNPKILFIGRECYSLATDPDYIDVFVPRYQAGQHPNGSSLNQDRFHKLLLKIAYGITHGEEDFNQIPQPSDMCKENIFDLFSFAFMNLSKLSNESDRYAQTDWRLVHTSLKMSLQQERNFIFDEIKLLDPDLIIAMNWGTHCFDNEFEQDRQTFRRIFGDQIDIKKDEWLKYTLSLGKKKVLLLDQWHFSARKNEKDDIYDPIYAEWKQFKEEVRH